MMVDQRRAYAVYIYIHATVIGKHEIPMSELAASEWYVITDENQRKQGIQFPHAIRIHPLVCLEHPRKGDDVHDRRGDCTHAQGKDCWMGVVGEVW